MYFGYVRIYYDSFRKKFNNVCTMRRKKMKKLVMIGLLTGALALTACGNKEVNADVQNATEDVAQVVEETTQDDGEVPEDMMFPTVDDYQGFYVDGDVMDGCNTFSVFEGDGNNAYTVDFSVFRLCDMEGVANWLDGALEIQFVDPSGEDMYAVFFPAEDDTFTMRITQSNWDYIESNTDFTGFTLSYQDDVWTGLENPWEEIDVEDMAPAIGYNLAVPEGATDVYCCVDKQDGIGELRFMLDETFYTARIKATSDFEDISGMYYDWTTTSEAKVGRCDAKCYRYVEEGNCAEICLWYDVVPGMMYSVSVWAPDLDGFDITAVAPQVYAPMQDEVE